MIRYVVPFPPGATSDSVGRIIAQRLSEVLGQTVVVENKPGAGTALAAEMVARAEPDGYTLFNITNATLAAVADGAALQQSVHTSASRDFRRSDTRLPRTLIVTANS